MWEDLTLVAAEKQGRLCDEAVPLTEDLRVSYLQPCGGTSEPPDQ